MKFKPDDMVEVLGYKGLPDKFGVIGKIGTVIKYYGDMPMVNWKITSKTWLVDIGGKRLVIVEEALRLIPPKNDSRDIGSWDQCPWSPYKKKVEA